ncbi:D-hexose-6-phosphate mutarotase [Shewanella sp. AS1]|uniref:D-hexose-6-phosphate mutarotase n=1 Tax=Shewanella sp. AS1 TaxID=2907626 RepID=UPI001F3E0097|nr:D-hexose-6-phosphate mutarotase [Shewanella sp. AS1]MCE9678584.1 D-hexose-6-phosphate mutarotase [Shewanella sp. AS1]
MACITQKVHQNGLTYLDIDTEFCQARIFMQGAQIDSFIPKGKAPLLWVSGADEYQPGSGIRGGIPICWPWFGMHENSNWPQHGFARTRIWQLDKIDTQNEVVELTLSLPLSAEDKAYWPHNTRVEAVFRLSHELKVSLINHNLSDDYVSLTQALHTYFPIQDIHRLRATGFSGSHYIEFGEGPYTQETDEVIFDKETDRVYNQLGDEQQLHTPEGIIKVRRENSQSAVLWNPWIEKSQRLSRFNDEDYLTMVCHEAANVLEDKVILAPGSSHSLSTIISWVV